MHTLEHILTWQHFMLCCGDISSHSRLISPRLKHVAVTIMLASVWDRRKLCPYKSSTCRSKRKMMLCKECPFFPTTSRTWEPCRAGCFYSRSINEFHWAGVMISGGERYIIMRFYPILLPSCLGSGHPGRTTLCSPSNSRIIEIWDLKDLFSLFSR